MSTVRRDFRSIPSRDAAATWGAIVDLITASSASGAARQELLNVSGIAASVIVEQSTKSSPILVTCDGPRTRIYCLYDDDALDDSCTNESKLGFDSTKGDWQVSLPVTADDLSWVQAALKAATTRVVARDAETGIDSGSDKKSGSASALTLDLEGFLKP